jgi:IS30 family transposase
MQHLRGQRTLRRSRYKRTESVGVGQIADAVSIRKCPAEVEDRAVPGHWEGDLIFGTHHSQIATLVERHSRYMMVAKVDGKDTETVINALIKQARRLPKELYKSLTWDRGVEISGHQQAKLNAVARQLNERPRKTLEFESPAERFNACVASTG